MSVFVESDNIISSLGFSCAENYKNVLSGITGIKRINDEKYSQSPIQTSIINNEIIDREFSNISENQSYTKFEKICILSISKALQNTDINLKSKKTILILSTTKGNIDLLNEKQGFSYDRVYLWKTAEIIADFFNAANKPVTVSCACISGVSAILLGKRLIDSNKYDNAVIVGADIISKFIVSGFQSFMSLSSEPCKPFDAGRDGLNLGEAAATIVITNRNKESNIEIVNGSTNNDANHISGPSKEGTGLFNAINNTLNNNKDIGFISAHGTATPYNDNMEAVAISKAELNDVYVNGLKGFFGHTLGAAGILETIISICAMKNNIVLKTMGYEKFGVSEKINVADKNTEKNINSFLKLTSGFGGCNGTLLIKKI